MNDRALSETAMRAGLHDIRLPANAPGELLAEIAAGVAAGALLAVVILLLLRLVTARSPREKTAPLSERFEAARRLPADARRVALLHLLKTHAPDVHARLRDRLYAKDSLGDDELETEVARLV